MIYLYKDIINVLPDAVIDPKSSPILWVLCLPSPSLVGLWQPGVPRRSS